MAESSAGITLSKAQEVNLVNAIDQRYGFQVADLKRLGGELDLNFRALRVDGAVRFVKLTPADFDADIIAWQNSVLHQLAAQPLSVQTPHLIGQGDGSVMSMVDLGDRFTATMRMTTWVPGVNVAELGVTNRVLRQQIGVLAAEVIESLSPLNSYVKNTYEHHWMVVKSGESIRETISEVDEVEKRDMLRVALGRFDEIEHLIPELPQSVVHQDLHDFNLLAEVEGSGDTVISGVVDFNDAVYTARIAELAVAAVYAGLRQQDPFKAFCEVVGGYLSRASVDAIELDLLYPLAVARLAVNASTWTARGKIGNTSYAESRVEATWPALKGFLSITPNQAHDTLCKLADLERPQPLECTNTGVLLPEGR